ncbi:hypothetical protein CC1G_09999 [Coprinopsis cinerea okayama7|uniref:HNH nuclease domain-containing protein n=1 Tax=Coprinopsis cinerea (strain Okayama-7 / 130 / ATCC MYA-4618 / FGSC 9003) TaxID=240176 RepID=A8NDJ1_COPC7|nr:hypothetical protein CC1G_09999 [Coprinopsis cinerea okayama7\|eukprot:XP_001832785.1 hypothetical protein CC1G_09999 [Coprinopsis cinerea okayama7\
MSKLPPSLPKPIQDLDDAQRAYNLLLELEKRLLIPSQEIQFGFGRASTSQPKTNADPRERRKLVLCRILGYLLHHAPTYEARASVIDGILACNGDAEEVLEFGEGFLYFIRAFHSNPAKTTTPSRDLFDRAASDLRVEDASGSSLQPKDHWSVKKYALKRDGYRCMISGAFDGDAGEQFPEILAKKRGVPGSRWAATRCSHIFAEVMNHDADNTVDEGNWSASIWMTLEKFGYASMLDELKGSSIHRLENVMTLDPTVHAHFESLKIWLVASDDPNAEPNTYKLEATRPLFIEDYPKIVRFQSSDPESLPLPSPRYLEVHAAVARIAHLSGATQYIDRVMRDLEDSTVLADDGSSGELLEHLLKQARPREIESH